jgi:hypothetical protein
MREKTPATDDEPLPRAQALRDHLRMVRMDLMMSKDPFERSRLAKEVTRLLDELKEFPEETRGEPPL